MKDALYKVQLRALGKYTKRKKGRCKALHLLTQPHVEVHMLALLAEADRSFSSKARLLMIAAERILTR